MSAKDPMKMTPTEKYDYIFGPQEDYYIRTRFGWFDALLSDIRTLIQGGQQLKNTPSVELGGNYGAGNVSIPILVCVGLELASALYTGKTDVMDHSRYQADENVRVFVNMFFPKNSSGDVTGIEIPLVLWDGIRNGNTHLFMPNVIKVGKTLVKFTFFVNMNRYRFSYVTRTKDKNIIEVHINGIEFYHLLRDAIEEYGKRLKVENGLQNNFINVWEAIDNTPHDLTKDVKKIPKEVKRLKSRLQFSDRVNIFANAHNGLLLSKYYQENTHELTRLLLLISKALK